MPLVAGWLSDRVGRRPIILGAYLGGAVGFVAFIAAGSSLLGLWVGIAIMGLFSFAESPQLQALLADVVPTGIRDVAFALYFTLAFGVGSLWTGRLQQRDHRPGPQQRHRDPSRSRSGGDPPSLRMAARKGTLPDPDRPARLSVSSRPLPPTMARMQPENRPS